MLLPLAVTSLTRWVVLQGVHLVRALFSASGVLGWRLGLQVFSRARPQQELLCSCIRNSGLRVTRQTYNVERDLHPARFRPVVASQVLMRSLCDQSQSLWEGSQGGSSLIASAQD